MARDQPLGFAGGQALETWHAYIDLPVVGELHVVSSVIFDVGVYLVVIGLMLDILRSLGGALDRQIEEEGASEPAFDATYGPWVESAPAHAGTTLADPDSGRPTAEGEAPR